MNGPNQPYFCPDVNDPRHLFVTTGRGLPQPHGPSKLLAMACTLVILAGGLGSRFGGLKQLAGMGPAGETLLEYALYDARRVGFDRFVMVVRPGMENDVREAILARLPPDLEVTLVPQALDDRPSDYPLATERTRPLGTAHAVWVTRDVIETHFAVINADDFYGRKGYHALKAFFDALPESKEPAFALISYALAGTLSPHGPVSRGICDVDENGFLLGLTEQTGLERRPDGKIGNVTGATFAENTPVSMNLFGFTPAVFPLLEEALESFLSRHSEDLTAECYLPSVVERAIGDRVASVVVHPTEARWFGVTYADDRREVAAALAELHRSGAYPTPLWARASD